MLPGSDEHDILLKLVSRALDSSDLTREDKEALKSGRNGLTKEIESIDAEIARLQGLRQDLSTTVKRIDEAASPIRFLPEELLQEIFLHLRELDSKDSTRKYNPDKHAPAHCLTLPLSSVGWTHPSPWILRQVCTTWRNLAFRLQFFCDIAVEIPCKRRKDEDALFWVETEDGINARKWGDLLRVTYSIASHMKNLTLRLYLSKAGDEWIEEIVSTALKILLYPEPLPIQELVIKCDDEHLYDVLVAGSDLFASVEHCTFIETFGNVAEPLLGRDIEQLNQALAPKIKHIRKIDMVASSDGNRNAPLALIHGLATTWSYLTDLTIDNQFVHNSWIKYAGAKLVNALRKCIQLVHLTLVVNYINPLQDNAVGRKHYQGIQDRFTLPNLVSLKICHKDPCILDCFNLPSLRSLELWGPFDPPISTIISVIDRSQCTIKTFRETGRRGLYRFVTSSDTHSLLKRLTAAEVVESTLPFTDSHLKEISKGSLLPEVKGLHFCYPSALDRLKIPESRLAQQSAQSMNHDAGIKRMLVFYRNFTQLRDADYFNRLPSWTVAGAEIIFQNSDNGDFGPWRKEDAY